MDTELDTDQPASTAAETWVIVGVIVMTLAASAACALVWWVV